MKTCHHCECSRLDHQPDGRRDLPCKNCDCGQYVRHPNDPLIRAGTLVCNVDRDGEPYPDPYYGKIQYSYVLGYDPSTDCYWCGVPFDRDRNGVYQRISRFYFASYQIAPTEVPGIPNRLSESLLTHGRAAVLQYIGDHAKTHWHKEC